MSKRCNVRTAVLIMAMLTSIMACGNHDGTNVHFPVILSLTPANGSVGDEITISGEYFGSSRDTSTVTINGTEATEYVNWSDVEIKVKIPLEATSGKLFVTVNGKRSNEVDVTVNLVTVFNGYKSVKIGNQVWMTSNLDVGCYRNGDPIPEVRDPIQWSDLRTGAWCYYENDSGNGTRLYNWYAVNDPRGLAPLGWHIPSDEEWTALTDYLGGEDVAGGKLKDRWSGWWHPPNAGATDEVKFGALPGGRRSESGSFGGYLYYGYWWASTSFDDRGAWYRRMSYDDTWTVDSINYKYNAFSVRCVAD